MTSMEQEEAPYPAGLEAGFIPITVIGTPQVALSKQKVPNGYMLGYNIDTSKKRALHNLSQALMYLDADVGVHVVYVWWELLST